MVQRKVAKSEVRKVARQRFGKDWYNVHPVIKKARLEWAQSYVSSPADYLWAPRVSVTEADGSKYTC